MSRGSKGDEAGEATGEAEIGVREGGVRKRTHHHWQVRGGVVADRDHELSLRMVLMSMMNGRQGMLRRRARRRKRRGRRAAARPC